MAWTGEIELEFGWFSNSLNAVQHSLKAFAEQRDLIFECVDAFITNTHESHPDIWIL